MIRLIWDKQNVTYEQMHFFVPHFILIQHAIMYQTFSSKAGLKYTNELNKRKHQFAIVSNNYF